MEAKNKAKELVDKFSQVASFHDMSDVEEEARFCAICCVEEIINSSKEYFKNTTYDEYWEEVLTEIENL